MKICKYIFPKIIIHFIKLKRNYLCRLQKVQATNNTRHDFRLFRSRLSHYRLSRSSELLERYPHPHQERRKCFLHVRSLIPMQLPKTICKVSDEKMELKN